MKGRFRKKPSFLFDIFEYVILTQLKYTELKDLKERWYKEQDGYCPLFCKQYSLDEFVIDHFHGLKSMEIGEGGRGLCRGAIHFQANSIEGKITNAFKRYGGDKHIDIVAFLRRLADYLEFNKIHTDEKYIHPSEKPKSPKLMKSSYNKLVKAINGKQKIPLYTKKFSKKLEALFIKYGIQPEFY